MLDASSGSVFLNVLIGFEQFYTLDIIITVGFIFLSRYWLLVIKSVKIDMVEF